MKILGKILVIVIVILLLLQCTSMAGINYFKSKNGQVMVYKQINAAKVTLSNNQILSDMIGGVEESAVNVQIEAPVEIYLVLDASGSMTINNRLDKTRKATVELIDKLSKKIKDLSLGLVLYSDEKYYYAYDITNDIDKIRSIVQNEYKNLPGPYTQIYVGLEKALEGFKKRTSGDDVKRFIVMLNDGELYHEDTISDQIDYFNENGIMTIMVFVDQKIFPFFAKLAQDKNVVNYQTQANNIGETISEQIYNLIIETTKYFEPPKYNNSESSYTAFLGDKIYYTVDPEIMHGAEINVEYLIKIKSFEDIKKIYIKDIYSSSLIYSKDKKLLTENGTNEQEGWKYSNGNLIYELSGNPAVSKNSAGIAEYEIKLLLSSILTSDASYDPIFSNNIEFELELANGTTIKPEDGKVYISNNGEITESSDGKIKAADIAFIPPFGAQEGTQIKEKIIICGIVGITVVLIVSIVIITRRKRNKT